mgnify:CR=1 FL=1
MPEVTVKEYADVIGITVERLQEQLQEAGFSDRAAEDQLSDTEKAELLGFLRRKRGKDDASEPKKITLKRKTVSELKVPISTQGRGKPRLKTVSVEFRKSKNYAKRSMLEEEANKQADEEQARKDALEAIEAKKIADEEAIITAKVEAEAAKEAEVAAAAQKAEELVAATTAEAAQSVDEQKNKEVSGDPVVQPVTPVLAPTKEKREKPSSTR